MRRGVRTEVMSFAAHAIVRCHRPTDAGFVVTSGCRWGKYMRDAYPEQAATVDAQAADLGFCGKEIERMWAHLAKICVIAGDGPDQLTATAYQDARTALHDTVITVRGHRPKTLSTQLFGLDAVMFHRGQAPAPDIRRRWTGRPVKEIVWDDLASRAPVLVATMRRYLDQCALSLRPS
jgi:3-keto-L-gulonate-6-phosphate decarboxylase